MVRSNSILFLSTAAGRISACILLILLIAGCDLFNVPPRGRERPGDQDAQITGFHALQLDEGVVKAQFGWKPQIGDSDSEERIEEARFFMRKDGPYTFPAHMWDGDTLQGRTLDHETDVHTYSAEWTGLSAGDEVWVTLYYRSEENWYAPLYDRVKLSEPAPEPVVYGGTLGTEYVVVIDSDNGDRYEIEESQTDYSITENQIAVLFFHDLSEPGYIQSAELDLDVVITSGSGTELSVAPLFSSRNIEWNIGEKIDNEAALSLDLSSLPDSLPVDISDVMKRAALYETNGIVLYTGPDLEVRISRNSEVLQNITYHPEN